VVELRKWPAVRPQHILDADDAARAQRSERLVLQREQLRRAARERFLDQLLFTAEVVIQQRDMGLRPRRNRPVRQRLEAVIGDQRLDGVEQSPARIVAPPPFGAGGSSVCTASTWSSGMALVL
jgi:hypothetical protein